MIKFFYTFLLILTFFTKLSYSASFIATVDKNIISNNDVINLRLTLHDTKATEKIDFSNLENDFVIYSQSQSSNISVINGVTSKNKAFNVVLFPKKEGYLTIPIFTIATKDGVLKTKPIKIKVDKQVSKNDKVKIITNISKKDPYVNESIIYKVKVVSDVDLFNTNLQMADLENVIIEQLGEVKQYEEIDNGISKTVNEITYILTPLKPGIITIDSAKLSGDIRVSKGRRDSLFGHFSMFDDSRYKPFIVQGNKIKINVKKAATNINEWLPLHSLQLSESWSNIKNAKVGEPINRTIVINATGIKSNQLPNTQYMESNKEFKIYTNKADVGDLNTNSGLPIATKSLSYAIIPKEKGEIIIPQIKISWWDVNDNKLKYASLPRKILTVGESDNIIDNSFNKIESKQEISKSHNKEIADNKILIIILTTLLIISIIYILILRHRLNSINIKKKVLSKDLDNKKIVRNIKSSKDINHLVKLLRDYCYVNLFIAKNSSLDEVKHSLIEFSSYDKNKIEDLFNKLNQSLYSNGKIQIKECKDELIKILQLVKLKNRTKNKKDNLTLNP